MRFMQPIIPMSPSDPTSNVNADALADLGCETAFAIDFAAANLVKKIPIELAIVDRFL